MAIKLLISLSFFYTQLIWADFPESRIPFNPDIFEEELKVFEEGFFNEGVLGEDFFEMVAEQRAKELPNYNFALESFDNFMPGSLVAEIPEEHGPGEIMIRDNQTQILKFYVAHIRYKFPIYVQVHQGRVVDFLARLPNYFLHDIFHQSLINRYGAQDTYFKKEPHAVYRWQNVEGNGLTYTGACTITCFPVYYAVTPNNVDINNYQSIPERLSTL